MCKLFDVFTRFSVGLIYLMYRAFERVALFKPVTSRPANSERFAVFSLFHTNSGCWFLSGDVLTGALHVL